MNVAAPAPYDIRICSDCFAGINGYISEMDPDHIPDALNCLHALESAHGCDVAPGDDLEDFDPRPCEGCSTTDAGHRFSATVFPTA